ncbi:MAG: hypothetical protein FWD65_07365 [Coriobacteriia bacterium]|nr:hypothetical protein [Coriobacteriia bacterium]
MSVVIPGSTVYRVQNAPSGTNLFSGPSGIAVDSKDNVYVVDQASPQGNVYKHSGWVTGVAWSAQPGNANAGRTLSAAPAAVLKTVGGETITDAGTSTVSAALTTANGATLSGGGSKGFTNGTAVFDNLSVNNAGTYSLTATANLQSSQIQKYYDGLNVYPTGQALSSFNVSATSSSFTISALPTLSLTPSPTTVTLGTGTSPVLKATANLAGGAALTGTITFTLVQGGAPTPIYTETLAVSGAGTYTTSTGYTLPGTAAAAGTYQWVATYSGDANNSPVATGANDPSAQVTVNAVQADLMLSKSVSDPVPNVDEEITFTVTLANLGPNDATNVTVSDPLPAGLNLIGADPSEGTYALGVWTVGTVTTAAPQTLTIRAQVVSPGRETNTAMITHVDQIDPDTINNTASATITPQQADLALSKTVDNPAPSIGDPVKYTITLTNKGPDAATNVFVQDPLPAGLTFANATASSGSYDSTTGLWAVGTVASEASQTLSIQATVGNASAKTNTATITSADQFDPDMSNNTASANTALPQADLELSKTVDNPTPNVGDQITFTITATNHGPGSATGVTVSDTLPAGLAFVSANPSEGTYAAGVWTVGKVTTAAPQTLTIVARVTSPAAQTNTATISAADQIDPDTSNNTASATITPQQADLELKKTVDNSFPNVNDTVKFTITLTNHGPDTATGVSVQDMLPTGLTFVGVTASQGSYDSATGNWSVGAVALGADQILTVQATVASSAAQTNTATISAADQYDPDTNNNRDSATVTPQQADLTLSKVVSDSTPYVDDTITFTITLGNKGPDEATHVTVNDILPAGLAFVDAIPSQGSYDDSTGEWTAGTVVPEAPLTLTVRARVDSTGDKTNTATITAADQYDPDMTNNSAQVLVVVNNPSLDLTLSSFPSIVTAVGQTVTYTFQVHNSGNVIITNPTVNVVSFSGTGPITVYIPQTSIDPGADAAGIFNYTVTQADIDAGQITLKAQIQGTAPNGVTVSSSTVNEQVDAYPTWGISLRPSGAYSFSPAVYGYTAHPSLNVTVNNTGNLSAGTGALSVALSGPGASNFTLSTDAITSIGLGDTGSFSVEPKTGLEAGTYTATVTVSGANVTSQSFDVSFTVRQKSLAGATVTLAPGPYVYTGDPLTPAVVSVVIDGITVPASDYDVSYANNINASPVTAPSPPLVTITAKSTSVNFYDQASVAFAIDKAQAPSIIWPTPAAVTYDPAKTLADVDIASSGSGDGTFAWADDTIIPTVGNSGYTVKFTPRDADNYDYSGVALSDVVALTVSKATPAYSAPTGLAATYGDTLASVTLPAGWTWDGGAGAGASAVGSVGAVGAQTHQATFTPTDTDNYDTVAGVDLSVMVAPKPLTVTADNQSKYYGEADPTLTWTAPGLLSGDTLAGSLTYAGTDVGHYDIVQDTPFSNPDYQVTFTQGIMTIMQTPATQDAIDTINDLPDSVKDKDDADKVAEATNAYDGLTDNEQAQVPRDVKDALAAAQAQAAAINHTDGKASVSGDLPWYVRLVVTPVPRSDSRYGAFRDKTSGKNLRYLYDIKLINTLTGETYELPAGKTVTVTLGGLALKGARGLGIAHEKESGTIQYLAAHVSGSTVTFTASSFSLYGVTAAKTGAPLAIPATGDALSLAQLWMCLAAGAALVLATLRLRRRGPGTGQREAKQVVS